MDHLPLQVREGDHVVVDDAECADPGGGKIKQNRRAEAAGANDQDAGAAERGLSRPADVGQHNVARVALKLFGTRRWGTKHRVKIGLNAARNHR